ncbi:GNAT family N-acetyltransferase [Brasilonema sp. UFV-L1]|uniref:GNAT family N-acetyltransferase n=1 Tax=Brasilonema sp. UFV-L1 TaxID=2234130 RepID=UPI00145D9F45|nr:GNAT family N-acetyltransferase [Brasilonema sp. UFV-L1]NMG06093.1 GNAT family N-acetyltransferase [Brasilonema sp. UFV-L1]
MYQIECFSEAQAKGFLPELVSLLQNVVNSGASVGFLPPLNSHTASQYWLEVFDALKNKSRLLLVARYGLTVVGTVQLDLCTRANGLHRAEVTKLMVHTAYRRRGIGYSLMEAVESEARIIGRTTLVLDTRLGDVSEKLYTKIGYIKVGEIPNYAKSADGSLHTTVIYYRLL